MKMKAADLLKKLNGIMIITVIILIILPSAFAQENKQAYRLKDIVVVATKDPSPAQEIPSSITAFDSDAIEDSGIDMFGDAAGYVPNINLVEFSERILSQPYFRGIGSGPNNPAVTTYIDGVPQLHGYSANIEFLDIEQIEFARGAQGMLYGRNTVGGVIHILSRSPNLSSWEYAFEGEYGSYDLMRGRFRFSGPFIQEKIGMSLAAGYASRDGFSDNDITGNDIDSREAFFTKLQLEWLPTDQWSARLILFSEQDRDGDYALHDLAVLRTNPYHGQRDFEGYVDRDIFAPTLRLEYNGDKVDFVSITGFVKWDTKGTTDLDYTPYPGMLRTQKISDRQFTQEFQWSSTESAEDTSFFLSYPVKISWQAGMLFFMQDYDETSVNDINDPGFPFPVQQTSPIAKLEDTGIGAYARATLTAWDVWNCSLGLRFDYEKKDADLQTFYTPGIAPSTSLKTDRDFTEISPHFSLTRIIEPGKIVYGSISRGYRAGGFNPVSLPGSAAYEEESSWNYEVGVKTTWLENKLKFNVAAFYITWDNLQINLPLGQTYYISNAGSAESAGAELELSARPLRNWDIFGSAGYNRTRLGDGTTSIRTDAYGVNTRVNAGGNDLIFAPDFTISAGTQYSWEIRADSRIFIRAEVIGNGSYFYNYANTESQDSYWLTNLRAGYKTSKWFAELWIKNALDKEYIPVAFEFPNGQSGFIGENGAPRMIGLRTGFNF